MPDAMTAAEVRVIERRLVAWCVECGMFGEGKGKVKAIREKHPRSVTRMIWVCLTCSDSWRQRADAMAHTCWAEGA